MNIGLTGGIACGKSTVARMLVDKGAVLIDADQIAREVVLPGSPALTEIVHTFGQAILHEDGTLNRKALGQQVFSDDTRRKQLESILHPRIRTWMMERKKQLELENPKRLVVVDVPLLYESELSHYFNEVLVVYVPFDVQLSRLMSRDRLSESEAKSRIDAQMSIEIKKEMADIVIDNSGTLEQTKQQVDQCWRSKGWT